MIATNYPNRDALYAAYTIYRDAMRRFIIRCLEKNGNTPPEQLINKALNHSEHNNIEINNAASIDIGNFPDIIVAYWKNEVSFSEEFDSDSKVRTDTETIKRGRKLWAHPRLEDTDPEETQKLLSLISKVLGEINAPNEKRKVEAIRNRLFPYDSESNLEKVWGELATLKKHQEAIDDRLTVVEEHCTNITNMLNQLRTALVKPLESKKHFTNEPNQLTEVEAPDEKSTTSHPSLEVSHSQNSTEVSDTLEVGQHLTGRVKKIILEGVFVTLALDKGEGFIPISELTLEPISHPSDVVQVDQEVEVIIVNLNEGNSEKKLPSLRLESKHNEWGNRVKEKYPEDSRHRGTVTNVNSEHGTFVEFEKGISGLIHHSNMHGFPELQKGQEIDVIISRINYEEERISLIP